MYFMSQNLKMVKEDEFCIFRHSKIKWASIYTVREPHRFITRIK